MDSDGNRIELLANHSGKIDITKAVRIDDAGKYLINVNADSDWTIGAAQE